MKLPDPTEQPRHLHACSACSSCRWLGQCASYDLYICTSVQRGTVLIARFGDHVHDCASLALRENTGDASLLVEPFRTAHQRAVDRGWLAVNAGRLV